MTCLMRASVGEIVRTPDGRDIFPDQLRISAAIAANGHQPSDAFMHGWEQTFSQRDSAYSTSMLRDIERGGRTEVEHVLGFMLKKAREADIPCHTLLLAYTHIKTFDARPAPSADPPPILTQDTPMTTLPACIPDKLTLRDIGCRAVRVPLVFTLGTSAAIVRAVPLLLVDLSRDEGPVGRLPLGCSDHQMLVGFFHGTAGVFLRTAGSPANHFRHEVLKSGGRNPMMGFVDPRICI
jgi:Ketopantoate reductase PanE/ApbA C terminal